MRSTRPNRRRLLVGAAYFYAARLPGEPAEGIAGVQVHPLEPISAVAKISYDF